MAADWVKRFVELKQRLSEVLRQQVRQVEATTMGAAGRIAFVNPTEEFGRHRWEPR